uniref:Uncharacterized protein n=1 Tax=Aegilops tauschii TaxID=37682 RepID=N1R5F4_AEGTA
MKQVLDLFQDNYPELVARNILINVPFSYYAFTTVFFPFLTQRTKSKLVVARPSKVTETLLKYIPIEAIPVKYGGLKRDGDTEFACEHDAEIAEVVVKANSTETIEMEATEVRYTEEFVPADEGAYTIVVSKGRKVGAGEEAVRNSFRAVEAGKVVITVENATRGRKRIIDLYVFFAMVTALVQVGYMGVVGSFPFNSFLSGVLSCIGTAVLAVCLRIQVNKDNKEFKDLPPERAFADFVLCNLVLHLVIINFLG